MNDSTKDKIDRKNYSERRQRGDTTTITVANHSIVDRRHRPGRYTGSIDANLGVPHGNGTMLYVDGSEYSGNWFRGDWSGFGRYECTKTEASYQGNFLDNIKNGLFVVTYHDGRLYDGEYQMDVMGKGVMKLPEGKYWGYFDTDGRPHGRGKLQMHDGREYDGEWAHGVMEGHGRMTYPDECGGEGYNDNDEIDNKRFKFYLGSFSNGKRCGLGMLVVGETIIHDGMWYMDLPIEASSVPSSRFWDADQSKGTCQRLLGPIPKNLSPCSRFTKKLLARNNRREHFSSSHIQRQ
jgi:hypothetical protein